MPSPARVHIAILTLALAPVGRVAASEPSADHAWSLAVYAGPHTSTRFVEIIQGHTEIRRSYVAALTATRPIHVHEGYAQWEVEAQVAQHAGKQHHTELNAALLLRWTRFPWNDRVRTGVALGIGPSFASKTPQIERDRGGETSRRLAAMPFEIAVGPASGHWDGILRVHHRSGVFDLVSRGTGSNFVALGFRRYF